MKVQCLKIISCLLMFIYGCNPDQQEGNDIQSRKKEFFADKERVIELINKSINLGDTSAYKEVHHFNYIDGHEEDVMYISIIMANKYNYPEAYYDVYSELSHRNIGFSLLKLDERTRNLALYYLALSKEKGCLFDDYQWGQAYGNKPLPSSDSLLTALSKMDGVKVK